MAVMEFLKRDIKPRDIVNEKSLRNALACDMALGCSTNTVLHLLAIAHEAGVAFDLSLFNEVSAQVPNLCHLAPAGPTHMQDLYAAGGIAAVQAELAKGGFLDTSLITATGKTVAENIKGAVIKVPARFVLFPILIAPRAASRFSGATSLPTAAW